MANIYLNKIMDKEIYNFVNVFCDWAPQLFVHEERSLLHSGEFGMYREKVVRNFLEKIIPGQLSLGEGFVINNRDGKDGISTQCDVIIYDKNYTPLVNNSFDDFYPIETVVGIGEVKSDLSLSDLEKAIVKLANNKKKREIDYEVTFIKRFPIADHFEAEKNRYKNLFARTAPDSVFRDNNENYYTKINELTEESEKEKLKAYLDNVNMFEAMKKKASSFNIETFHNDHVFSFLICNKITGIDPHELPNKLNEIYKRNRIKRIHRHNIILSINDGLFLYHDPIGSKKGDGQHFPFPNKWENKLKNCFIPRYVDNIEKIKNIFYKELISYNLTNKRTKFKQIKQKLIQSLSLEVDKFIAGRIEEIDRNKIEEKLSYLISLSENKIITGKDFKGLNYSEDLTIKLMNALSIPVYFKDRDPIEHIKIFYHYLFQSTTDITIIYPEMAQYLNPILFNKETTIED